MTAFLEICTRKLVEDLLQWTFLSLTFEFTFPTQDRECVLTAIIIFLQRFFVVPYSHDCEIWSWIAPFEDRLHFHLSTRISYQGLVVSV